MTSVRVTVTRAKGSTPRDAGTSMLVFADRIEGTIGGGALEWQAMQVARQMLAEGKSEHDLALPLGPSLGQCCGGAVTLRFEAGRPLVPQTGAPVWIWGAGHVGRALVHTLAPCDAIKLVWVDTEAERFPRETPSFVDVVVATEPALLMPRAPNDARHVILTYSHDLDFDLCHAALRHGFKSCGVIGSATKWARFRSRLARLGHTIAAIDQITCPIGDPSLGKVPQAIAIGVAAQVLSTCAAEPQMSRMEQRRAPKPATANNVPAERS